MGRPLGDLDVASRASVEGRLGRPESFEDVDLRARALPVYVTGEIEIAGQEPASVAVAINGVVAGWQNAYFKTFFPQPEELGPGRHIRRFWMMVPPSLLREGDNDVEVFMIRGGPGDERLEPVRLAG